MYAAAVRFDLYLRDCRSLKAKRAATKPVIEGLRRRYGVSVAEVEYQDAWHRCAVGVAAVASSESHLRDILDDVERFVWSFPEVEVLAADRSWLEVDR